MYRLILAFIIIWSLSASKVYSLNSIRVNYPPDTPLADVPVVTPDGPLPGLDIGLTVEERAGVARTHWPVTSGLPLPKGMLTASGTLYSGGIQARPLSHWDDGSVKWLLVDFQADVAANGTAGYNLATGAYSASPLKAEEDAGKITVVTGPLRLMVSKTTGNLFDGVWMDKNTDGQFVPSEQIVPSNPYDGAIITDAAGKRFYSSLGPVETTEIVEKGPLKVVIRIQGGFRSEDGDWPKAVNGPSTGEDLLKYTAYITAFAEKGFVKVDFHLKNGNGSDANQANLGYGYIEFEDLSLRTNPALSGAKSCALGGDGGNLDYSSALALGQRVSLYQDSSGGEHWEPAEGWETTFQGYKIYHDGREVESGLKAEGWTDISDANWGLTTGCRLFWQNFPKSLEVNDSGEVYVGLWPDDWAVPHLFRAGQHKGHEVFYYFHTGNHSEAQSEDIAKSFHYPLFSRCTSEYYCETLKTTAPEDYTNFLIHEGWADVSVSGIENERENSDCYGWRNFGDSYRDGDKVTRYWGNNEFDFGWCMLNQFLRKGDLAFLDNGLYMSQHMRDIDIYHTDRDVNASVFNHGPHKHDASGITDHSRAPLPSHMWLNGLLLRYQLTGDPEALVAAKEIGQYISGRTTPGLYVETRNIGWSLCGMMELYEATGYEAAYLNGARSIVYDCLLPYVQENGALTQPDGSLCPWAMGYVMEGLGEYCLAKRDASAPDLEAENALIKMADFIIDELWIDEPIGDGYGNVWPAGTGHWWTDYPNNKEGNYIYSRQNGIAYVGSPNTQTLIDGWTYTYRLTRDKKYYDYAKRAFEYYLNYPDHPPYYGGQSAAKGAGFMLRFGQAYMYESAHPDTTGPVISDVQAGPVGSESAVITFATDETSTATIEYGPDTGYGSSLSDTNPVKNHRLQLNGLSPLTEYHYRIMATDGFGNSTASPDYTFTTTSSDTTAPVISELRLFNPLPNSVTIRWQTDELATSQVEYGKTPSLGSASLDTTMVTSHSLTLSGLDEGDTYYYRVKSRDISDNEAVSSTQGFITPRQEIWGENSSSDHAGTGFDSYLTIDSPDNYPTSAWLYLTSNHAILLDFDLSAIPQEAAVTQATLRLYATYPYWHSPLVGMLYRITDPAGLGDWNGALANWRNRNTGLPWSNRGDGDIDTCFSLVVDAVRVDAFDPDHWFEWDVTGAVAGWVAGTYLNQGMMIYPDGTGGNSFASAEESNASWRPILEITYGFDLPVMRLEITSPPVGGKTANHSFDITWTDLDPDNSNTISLYYDTDQVGYDGVLIAAGLSEDDETDSYTWDISGLAEGEYYIYGRMSHGLDTVSDYSKGSLKVDRSLPVISGVNASNVTDVSARINWTTDEGATSQVEYGLSADYANTTSLDPALVTNHTVTLTGLVSSTTYYYRVRSRDSLGNESVSNDGTFTTAADQTPPQISNITHSNIGENVATITWTTDEASTSKVEYGTTTSYGQAAQEGSFVTSHSIALSGLLAFTTYHYRVISTDGSNNANTSADQTFTTIEADTTAPVISEIIVSNIGNDQATITWQTDEPSTSGVEYGLNAGYGNQVTDPSLTTHHSITLTGLNHHTTYHFRVRSRDGAPQSNEAVSGDQTFATSVKTEIWGENSASDYPGTCFDTSFIVNGTGSYPTYHELWVTPGGDTHWKRMAVLYFDLSDLPPQSVISQANLKLYTDFISGGESNIQEILAYRITDPDNLGDWDRTRADWFNRSSPWRLGGADITTVSSDPLDTITVNPFTSSTHWFSWDVTPAVVGWNEGSFPNQGLFLATANLNSPTGNFFPSSEAVDASLRPVLEITYFDTAAPVISEVTHSLITGEGARITWTTDELAASQVEYGPDTNYGFFSPHDTRPTRSHQIDLQGLSAGATYHYRVRSTDPSANLALSGDAAFTTTAPDTTPPVISNVEMVNVSDRSAVVQWSTDETADSIVDFGQTLAYGSTASDSTYLTSHRIDLSGLLPNTTYHLRIRSRDPSGNEAVSEGHIVFTQAEIVTISFQNGALPDASYTGCLDTTVSTYYQDPNANFGNASNIEATHPLEGFLIKWNISSLPSGAIIDSALISLRQVWASYSSGHTLKAYEVLQDWEEMEATWNSRKTGTAWNSSGLGATSDTAPPDSAFDRRATDCGSFQTVGANEVCSLTITPSLVQAWANNGSANYGLFITPEVAGNSFFYSRNYSTPLDRPKLTISYHFPTEPQISITQPPQTGAATNGTYPITWLDHCPELDAGITLYYDRDDTGHDGQEIIRGISEDDETDSYSWDTSQTPEETYYIYGKIDDGVNTPVYHYSGPLTINRTPPPVVFNLSLSDTGPSMAGLAWTAPASAVEYDIRYSLTQITAANWNGAAQAVGEPVPQVADSPESFTIYGLQPDADYYFALKSKDGLGNWSDISNVAHTKTPRLRALWIWNPEAADIINDAGPARTDLFDFCSSPHGDSTKSVNAFFISAGDLVTTNPNQVRNFLTEAHARRFRIEYLCGDPNWATPAHRPEGEARCEAIISFNQAGLPSQRFDGFHLDVKPYTLSDWNSQYSTYWQEYKTLLTNCRSKLLSFNAGYEPNITLNCDIPYWYDTDSDTGSEVTSTQDVQQIGDWVTIMDYRDDTAGIIAGAEGEVQTANAAGKGVIIGVNTSPPADEPETITFYEEGVTFMEEQLAVVLDEFDPDTGFLGLAVHDYGDYKTLRGDNAPPSLNITSPPPSGAAANNSYRITWSDYDLEDNAAISLFYDKDDTGGDGIQIVAGISEDDETDAYSWDTSLLTEGNYYLYGRIDDGVNPAVFAYSRGPLTIDHTPPAVTILSPPDGASTSLPQVNISGIATDNRTSVKAIAIDVEKWNSGDTANFVFAVDLVPDTNTFLVTATDYADNSGAGRVTIYYYPDNTSPAAVDDLNTSGVTTTTISLTWTAPGDDGDIGQTFVYELRYSTSPIIEAGWDSATQVSGEPGPSPAGSTESFTITGLIPETTYYFALKSKDEVGNTSDTSNQVTAATNPLDTENTPPLIDPSLDNLSTLEDTRLELDLTPYGSDVEDSGFLVWSLDSGSVDTAIFEAGAANNLLTIIPKPNQFGQDDITLILTDPNGGQDTKADVTVIVAPVNDPPVIDPACDDLTTPEDTPATFDLTPYGSDVDDTGLVWSIDPASAATTLFTAEIANHRLTIIPLPNQYGQDDVTIILTDPNGEQDTKADVTVTVAPVNDPPVIDPACDGFTTPEDTPATFDLTPYGSDVDDTGLVWSIDSASAATTLFTAEVVNNRLTINPFPNQCGQANVTLWLTDPNGNQDTKTNVTMTVAPVNDPPVIDPACDGFTTPEDTPATFDLTPYGFDVDDAGLVWNINLDSVDTTLFTAEVANDRLTIIPLPNQYGQADVTLWLTDPNGSQDIKADVTMTVAPVNDPPVIDPACDGFTTPEDTPTTFDLTPYGFDVDDAGLVWNIDLDSADTTLFTAEVANDRLTIIPLPNQYGQADVTLILTDSNGEQSTKADVTVIVAPVNDPPVIDPACDGFTTPEDTPATFDLTPYGSDVNDAWLVWNIDLDSVDTTLFTAEVANNQLTITPLPNQYGQADVTLWLTDPEGSQDTKTDVTVIVAPVNDPPVIDPACDDLTTPEDTPADFDLSPYGSDVDDTGLTWSIDPDTVDTASDGGLVFTAEVVNNRLTIIPLPNQYGQDDITLILTDPNGEQDTKAEVTVIVASVNDPPVIDPACDNFMVDGDTPTGFDLSQYRLDVDDTNLTWSIQPDTVDATLFEALISADTLTINPISGSHGQEDITLILSDPSGDQDVKQDVTIIVNHVNHAPFIDPSCDDFMVDEDIRAEFDLSPYGTDGDLTALTWSISLTSVDTGLFEANLSDTLLTIVPQPNQHGQDDITLILTDSEGAKYIKADVTIIIRPVNDPPVIDPVCDDFTTPEDTPATFGLTPYGSDIDDTGLTWTLDPNSVATILF
ncbi:MAG: fibronectin type III domain-containing protein, partial [bacterium]